MLPVQRRFFWGCGEPPRRRTLGIFTSHCILPTTSFPLLDDRTLNAIADYFQRRLLQYRLNCAKAVREFQFVVSRPPPSHP